MKHIIIADTYQHTDIMQSLLQSDKTIENIDILSFSMYLDSFLTNTYPSKIETIKEIASIFKTQTSDLFNDLLYSNSFHNEIYRILDNLYMNASTIDELPQNTKTQKELARLLSSVKDVRFHALKYKEIYKKIQACSSFDGIEFLDIYPTNAYEQMIFDYMCQHGAKHRYSIITPTNISYIHSINQRNEIEVVANTICTKLRDTSLDAIQVVIPDDSYLPFISLVFKRYNIPYYYAKEKISCESQSAIISYLQFLSSKRIEDLYTFLYSPLFKIEGIKSFTSYMNAFELEYEDIFNPFEKVSHIDFSKEVFNNFREDTLQQLEDQAKVAQEEIQKLIRCIQTTSAYDFARSVYNLFIDKELSDNDIRFLNSFKESIIDAGHIFSTMTAQEALPYIHSIIQNITIQAPRKTGVVRITTYTSTYKNCSHSFICGVHQKNYPNFSVLSGVFDEALVRELPHYPTLETRYSSYKKQLENNFSVSENVYFSYPESGFDGKRIESSLELELAFHIQKPQNVVVPLNDVRHYRKYELSLEHAKELLYKDNQIKGSVSSIETYFKCPYRYFLMKGLHVRNLRNIEIKENALGSLQHKFFEIMVDKYKKDYYMHTEEIHDFLKEQFDAYSALYPKKHDMIETMKKIVYQSLFEAFENLKDIEEHSRAIPYQSELGFETDYLTHQGVTLTLRGFIDRIDTLNGGFRIIDYKSSAHKLEYPKFDKGLTLQLPTYMSIMKKQKEGWKPYGAYYYNFTTPTAKYTPYKVTKAKKSNPINEINEIEKTKPKEQFVGQTFVSTHEELSQLDDTATHINCLKLTKEGEIQSSSTKTRDFDSVEQELCEIYAYFIEQLMNAQITCSPNDSACIYCDFGRICGFKGKLRKDKNLPIPSLSEVTEESEAEQND